MKLLTTLLLTICLCGNLLAQKNDAEIPRLLIGTEVQVYFENLDYAGSTFGNSAYGLNIQKPIGRFTIGASILSEQFGKHRFWEFTGAAYLEEDGDRLVYDYQVQDRKIRFYSLPLQIQFRLPCNCVFLQAGLVPSLLNRQASAPDPRYIDPRFDEPSSAPFFSSTSIQRISLGYQMGMGLNFHFSRHLKSTLRFLYGQYNFIDDSRQRYKTLGNSYLGLNLALQYALY